MTGPRIFEAVSPGDYDAFAANTRAYVDWCAARNSDLDGFVGGVTSHQELEAELAVLPVRYGPPNGRTLLVRLDDRIIGAGAYLREDAQTCQLKRVYVGDTARGHGIGRRLIVALMDTARADGFATMRLDTGDRLTEAIALYGALGFERVAPFHAYPPDLASHMVFMSCDLSKETST